ncbi:MoaD/ThiS family protein [Raineyella antarctica]|nr:MoaD/ThiS family protein [Raineyella antarctica]
MATITIRYWAGARDAAGVETDVVEAPTVAAALDRAAAARPGDAEYARVIGLCSFLVDGRRLGDADRTRPLTGPVELEALPPFAGG